MARLQTIHERFNGKCAYCGEQTYILPSRLWSSHPRYRRATIDHDVPKVRGGSNRVGNLLLSCAACNSAKSDMTADEFRRFLRTQRFPRSYIAYLRTKARNHAQHYFRTIPKRERPRASLASCLVWFTRQAA